MRYEQALTLAALLAVLTCACEKKAQHSPPPAPTVDVMAVQPTTLPIFEEWIATLDGFVNAQVRAQVTGYVLTQNYAEGHQVKKGDLMFRIDPRTFEAAVAQAGAKLAQDRAQVEKARLDVERYTPLAQEQAISKEQLVNAVQARLALEAQVKADQAAMKSAQLNLEFTRIVSPIDGLAGIAHAQIGDLASPSTGPLATVSTIDPIKAYFYVNQADYFDYWRQQLGPDGGASDVELDLVLANDAVYPRKGRLFFAARQVNPSTGTLQVVGLFPNPDFQLRPGQTARVRARTRLARNVLAVPQAAVSELQTAFRVAVIAEHDTVDFRQVEAGRRVGSLWIIESGLQPGERVVVQGLQKIKQGQSARPHLVEPKAAEPEPSKAANPSGP